MMKRIQKSRTGGALVETAISLMVAIPLVTFIPQAWQTISVYDELEYVACAGARFASVEDPGPGGSVDRLEAAVTEYVLHNVVPNTTFAHYNGAVDLIDVDIELVVDDRTAGAVDPGDVLRVTIHMPVNGADQFQSFLIDWGQPDEAMRSCTFTQIMSQ